MIPEWKSHRYHIIYIYTYIYIHTQKYVCYNNTTICYTHIYIYGYVTCNCSSGQESSAAWPGVSRISLVNLALVSREWRNGSNRSYNCTPIPPFPTNSSNMVSPAPSALNPKPFSYPNELEQGSLKGSFKRGL